MLKVEEEIRNANALERLLLTKKLRDQGLFLKYRVEKIDEKLLLEEAKKRTLKKVE
jgi:hypothetical protein